jgi:hypothetical protein
LQPALASRTVQYAKTWFEDQWVHVITYANNHRIVITPTAITATQHDKQCSIDQGLVYYLDVALSIVPPATAKDRLDAAMVGYILCFRDGHLNCPHYMNYAPPTLPAIDTLLNTRSVIAKVSNKKDNGGHLSEIAHEALKLAQDIRQNAEKEWVPVKDVEELIVHYTPQFKIRDDHPYREEATRIDNTIHHFLNQLFGTAAWQNEYQRFRNDFLALGCQETKDPNSDIRHVDCSQFGYQFSVQTYTGIRISQAN